jgi:hypothetical protein
MWRENTLLPMMNRSERLRRTTILCCHTLRNLAFYRAGWSHTRLRVLHPFWVNANGNFLDVAVLEWCKLFAERNGKHHWKRVIRDHPTFIEDLCDSLDLTAKGFHDYAAGVQRYRNKFVAHLDEERVMNIPTLRVARKSVAYLFDALRRDADAQQAIPDARQSSKEFYSLMYRHAYEQYRRGT